MKKIRLAVNSVAQYQAVANLYYFLDQLGLKHAWKANRKVVDVHGEYWEECDHCGLPMGEHDDPCLDSDGQLYRRWNEDDIER